jgi:xanthine dehydrogenase accessory factor
VNDGLSRLAALLASGTPVVRMVVAGVRGSAPREPGASLLYWQDPSGRLCSLGSVGGGRLEEQAMEIARYLLRPTPQPLPQPLSQPLPQATSQAKWQQAQQVSQTPRRRVQSFTLGASLGQCCGGVVELFWERFDSLTQAQDLLRHAAPDTDADAQLVDGSERLRYCILDASEREWVLTRDAAKGQELPVAEFSDGAAILRDGTSAYFVERLADDSCALWIYGAGHVGRALVHVLADLPFRITWVDSRPQMLAQAIAALPPARRERIRAIADEPDASCAGAPDAAWHLVMTHCHDQDLRVCEALIARGRFGMLGVIGSRTKSARFRHRLQAKGYAPEVIARMRCPIGIEGIRDKRPAAIAVAVAAQLLTQRTPAQRPASNGDGLSLQRAPGELVR